MKDKHIEFVDTLNKFGISIRSTNDESPKVFEIAHGLGSAKIIKTGFDLKFEDKSIGADPLKRLLKTAIDYDSWKHSWHNEIIEENYENFEEIIKQKIIKRAEEIDELLSIYFLLKRELTISKQDDNK